MSAQTKEASAITAIDAALKLNQWRHSEHIANSINAVHYPLCLARETVIELIALKERIDSYCADLPWKDDCSEPGLYDVRTLGGTIYRAMRIGRHTSSGNLQCIPLGMNIRTMRGHYQFRRIPDAVVEALNNAS